MSCKSCRRHVFDWRDGTLDASRRISVEAHLEGCPDCRAFYEAEALLGVRVGEAFQRVGAVYGPAPATAETASKGRALRGHRAPASGRGRRFDRRRLGWMAAAGTAALLAMVFILRPRPAPPLIEPTSAETVVLDDFPDPLRDWVEGRLIITIEEASGGARQSYLATRDGTIRRIAEKGRS